MVRRLPCCKELPRSWTAAMRPTPVMIPVNMAVFSQEWKDRPFRLELVAAGNACDQPQVGTDFVAAKEFEPHDLRQVGQRAEVRHLTPLAHQFGSQIDEQFVDQPFADQRSIELVAG